MAKIYCCILTVLLFSLSNCKRVSETDIGKELAVNTEPTSVLTDLSTEPIEVIPAEESILDEPEILEAPKVLSLQEIYQSQIGVREYSGNNDGPEVEMYLRSVGLGKGYSWCSAFVKWSLDEAEIPNKINAWSPTAENKSYFVYTDKRFLIEPAPGDVFTIWYPRLKRIGHTGFIDGKQNEIIFITVEGNTSIQGSRDGDGVYKRYRPIKTIHSISRWE